MFLLCWAGSRPAAPWTGLSVTPALLPRSLARLRQLSARRRQPGVTAAARLNHSGRRTARRGWRGQPPHTAIYPTLLSLHSCNFYYCLQFFLCIFLGSNDCNIRLRLLSTVRRGSAAARGHVRETKQCKLAGSRRNPRYSHCQ